MRMYSTFPISLESFFPFFLGEVFVSIDSVYFVPFSKISNLNWIFLVVARCFKLCLHWVYLDWTVVDETSDF